MIHTGMQVKAILGHLKSYAHTHTHTNMTCTDRAAEYLGSQAVGLYYMTPERAPGPRSSERPLR